ncbi:hypothetical protein J7L36_00905 [bacterium]|nr:hypothetical protein [bacterium]
MSENNKITVKGLGIIKEEILKQIEEKLKEFENIELSNLQIDDLSLFVEATINFEINLK